MNPALRIHELKSLIRTRENATTELGLIRAEYVDALHKIGSAVVGTKFGEGEGKAFDQILAEVHAIDGRLTNIASSLASLKAELRSLLVEEAIQALSERNRQIERAEAKRKKEEARARRDRERARREEIKARRDEERARREEIKARRDEERARREEIKARRDEERAERRERKEEEQRRKQEGERAPSITPPQAEATTARSEKRWRDWGGVEIEPAELPVPVSEILAPDEEDATPLLCDEVDRRATATMQWAPWARRTRGSRRYEGFRREARRV